MKSRCAEEIQAPTRIFLPGVGGRNRHRELSSSYAAQRDQKVGVCCANNGRNRASSTNDRNSYMFEAVVVKNGRQCLLAMVSIAALVAVGCGGGTGTGSNSAGTAGGGGYNNGGNNGGRYGGSGGQPGGSA